MIFFGKLSVLLFISFLSYFVFPSNHCSTEKLLLSGFTFIPFSLHYALLYYIFKALLDKNLRKYAIYDGFKLKMKVALYDEDY